MNRSILGSRARLVLNGIVGLALAAAAWFAFGGSAGSWSPGSSAIVISIATVVLALAALGTLFALPAAARLAGLAAVLIGTYNLLYALMLVFVAWEPTGWLTRLAFSLALLAWGTLVALGFAGGRRASEEEETAAAKAPDAASDEPAKV